MEPRRYTYTLKIIDEDAEVWWNEYHGPWTRQELYDYIGEVQDMGLVVIISNAIMEEQHGVR